MEATPKILVVDDDPNTLERISGTLRAAKYQVLAAGSGSEALRLAVQALPQLILLKSVLADMQGHEVCRLIKTNPRLRQTLVVHLVPPAPTIPATIPDSECGVDGRIEQPIGERALLAFVRAMLRVGVAEENLRRAEQLWRTVFVKTRDAVLLVDESLVIFEANPKALQMYGYASGELKGWPIGELCSAQARETLEARFRMIARGHGFVLRTEQQRKNGEAFSVELQARQFRAEARVWFEVLVWDLDEDPQAESDSRAITRELDALARYSAEAQASVAEEMYGGGPLQRSLPVRFAELASEYERILELGIEQKAYRVELDLSERLRGLAAQLGALRGTPRDVVEVHTTVLKHKSAMESSRKRQVYHDEGRFMLLELMGHLASYYRDRSSGTLGAGGRQ